MNFARRASTIYLLVASIVSVFIGETVTACTSIALRAEDSAVVYGRTMEWGSFDLNSRLVVVPRGHTFKGHTPDGKPGYSWKTRYGVVALDMIEKDYLADGMNEKGLIVGVLYHPGFAKYQSYDPDRAGITMGPTDFPNFVLTQFTTVEEVREGLKEIRVVPIPEPVLGGVPAPLHLTVIDKSGNAVVVEYLNGELKIFENPLQVLTNAPNFDWHMTNLRNYINLSPVAFPTKKIEDLDFAAIGGGSGFLGIPGDYTPPSRFVRAVAYSQSARKTPNGDETLYEVFRILDNFNLPLGSAEGPDANPELIEGMRSTTLWTSAADSKNLKYYYHTQHNRKVRMIDLKKIDFSPNKEGIKRFPLDRQKSQDIEDVTPK